MHDRYWMFQRNGIFYVQDKLNGKQKSLKTRDAAAARRMFAGKNQATEQPQMNIAMARVYLSCKNPEMLARTWDDVMKDMEEAYHGPTLARWRTQMKSVPFQGFRKLQLLQTESSHFLAVLRHPRAGTSTQKWLRILHNRAMDLLDFGSGHGTTDLAEAAYPENEGDLGGTAYPFDRDGTGCRV